VVRRGDRGPRILPGSMFEVRPATSPPKTPRAAATACTMRPAVAMKVSAAWITLRPGAPPPEGLPSERKEGRRVPVPTPRGRAGPPQKAGPRALPRTPATAAAPEGELGGGTRAEPLMSRGIGSESAELARRYE